MHAHATTLFDRYVFIDWSSATGIAPERPRKDSIWIGVTDQGGRPTSIYCRSRRAAATQVQTLISQTLQRDGRILVGFDFPYGYPTGFAAAAAGLSKAPWLSTWEAISGLLKDEANNQSNRFEVAGILNGLVSGGMGPFWGCPVGNRSGTLRSTGPGFPFALPLGGELSRLREVERRLPGTQEAWKLYGAGSVGSQALTGIPRVHELRFSPTLADKSAVWPFETGFTAASPASVIHAEIWPGVVRAKAAMRTDLIPDEAQVLTMCEWANDLDCCGELGGWFEKPRDLPDEKLRAVLEEEGWILGCR